MKRTWMSAAALASLAFAAAALPLAAQEKPKDAKPAPEPVEIRPADEGGAEDAHAEMERLFGEIERKMTKVNQLLERASAGSRGSSEARTGIQEAVDTIDKLLRQSQRESQSTVQAIDKILELSTHPHPGGT